MAVHNTDEAGRSLKGGVLGGLIAGIVLSLFMLATNIMNGSDVWVGMKAAGLPFLGERGKLPGFDAVAVVVGVFSHMVVSIVWGTLFGLLFYGLSKTATLVAGLGWGIVVWIGMAYVLLPLLGLGDLMAGMPIGLAMLEHLLFGEVVAIVFLPFQRSIPRRQLHPRHSG